MTTQWPVLALCQCLLVGMVHSAALSTEDTLVVSNSNGVETTEVPYVDPDTSTDEPNAPIKLTDMQVHSEIALRYARTAVTARVRNPARRPQEASFRVLLPDTAFISGFVMTLDGKSYKAYVKGKEEAKQIYNEAVSQGLGAAHVTAKARDSNHFTVSVNVEPNTTALFNLTYEELLVRRNGVYNHAINLHPGAVVPNMQVTVHIKESQKITQLRVPEMRTGNEVDATELDAQNPLAVIQKNNNQEEATVTFKPDLDEQKRLMGVYMDKMRQPSTRRGGWNSDRDNADAQQDGVLGQFVVQYDVDRSNTGEILVNDGYFVHFLAPTSLPPLSKHVVFVLDTSSSMMGRKIIQLREAMQAILDKLNKGDYFNIVEFNSYVKVHDLNNINEPAEMPRFSSYSYHYPRPQMVEPALASTENINKAKTIISRLDATSLTNIYDALDVAIELIHKGVNASSYLRPSTPESSKLNNTNIEISNEVGQRLEPIIIFLTDGEPTAGESDIGRIISSLTEKNQGEKKASIYTLALGDDADRNFLRKFSLRNNGFMRHIYEAADTALQLRDFYRQVASPLLADVRFTYPKEQIKEGSVTRNQYRTIYDGAEVIVAGKIADDITEITSHVYGTCGVGDGFRRKRYEISPRVPVTRSKSDFYPLERLWAYLTIKQLLDEKDASDSDKKDENSPEKKALALALKYEFVTPLTSLVVVKPNSTTAVGAESVDAQRQDLSGYAASTSQIRHSLISGNPQPSSHLLSMFGPLPNRVSYNMANMRPTWVNLGSSFDPSPTFSVFQQSMGNSYSDLRSNVMPLSGSFDSFPHLSPNTGFAGKNLGYPSLTNSHRLLMSPRRYYKNHGSSFSSASDNFDYDLSLTDTIRSDDFDGIYNVSPTMTPGPNPLVPYKLEGYSWASPLVFPHTDNLVLQYLNGTEVTFKLSRNKNVPKNDGGDVDCAKATDGAAGACVYLTRCAAAKHISVDIYRDTQCFVNNEYAGVCCPKNEIDINPN